MTSPRQEVSGEGMDYPTLLVQLERELASFDQRRATVERAIVCVRAVIASESSRSLSGREPTK